LVPSFSTDYYCNSFSVKTSMGESEVNKLKEPVYDIIEDLDLV